VGGDGGWWLPLLSSRRNTMPPQYALNETSQPKDYTRKVVDLVTVLETNKPDSPSGLSAICQMGVSYVYIGQRQGLVGFAVKQLFNRDLFLMSDKFIEIYRQDRVSILSIKPGACQSLVSLQQNQALTP
jgi:hypothetical protein